MLARPSAARYASCPLPLFRPDLAAVADGEGSPEAFFFKEVNAHLPSSAIRENIKTTSDPPPQ